MPTYIHTHTQETYIQLFLQTPNTQDMTTDII